MKKIVAIFLLIAITTVFVSCGNKDKNSETPPLQTNVGPNPNIESTTAGNLSNQGYILTTVPGQTVYWGNTTAFIPTAHNNTTAPTIVVPIVSDPPTSAITPNISQVTIPSTQPTSNNSNTGPTVVDAPDNTTAPQISDDQQGNDSGSNNGGVKAEAKPVSSSSASKMSNGDITIDISASGWDSAIVSNTGTATVNYGSNTESASCSVSATMEGGSYVITVYTSKLDIYSGATVTITIPEGLIKTASGTQYNRAFTSKAITF